MLDSLLLPACSVNWLGEIEGESFGLDKTRIFDNVVRQLRQLADYVGKTTLGQGLICNSTMHPRSFADCYFATLNLLPGNGEMLVGSECREIPMGNHDEAIRRMFVSRIRGPLPT